MWIIATILAMAMLVRCPSVEPNHLLTSSQMKRGTATVMPEPPAIVPPQSIAVGIRVVMAAAVADFRPKRSVDTKLSKEEGIPDIVLAQTPDILAGLAARRRPGQVLVGFAAETHNALERGRRKLARKGVDLLVVNDVSEPGAWFDHDTNAVVILEADGRSQEIPLTSKDAVANAILDRVIAHHNEKRSTT